MLSSICAVASLLALAVSAPIGQNYGGPYGGKPLLGAAGHYGGPAQYGGLARGTYGGPSAVNNHYGSSYGKPQDNSYGTHSQHTESYSSSTTYGDNDSYKAPQQHQRSYGAAPKLPGYGQAPKLQGYGQVPKLQGYGQAPKFQGYGQVPKFQGYGPAPNHQGYGPKPFQAPVQNHRGYPDNRNQGREMKYTINDPYNRGTTHVTETHVVSNREMHGPEAEAAMKRLMGSMGPGSYGGSGGYQDLAKGFGLSFY